MRRIFFDEHGEPTLYLTGGGAMYNLQNEPVGRLQDEAVVDYRGEVRGWLEDHFLWATDGKLLAFVKGAKPADASFELPKTQKLTVKLEPTPAPFHPMLKPRVKPALQWQWSEQPVETLFGDVPI